MLITAEAPCAANQPLTAVAPARIVSSADRPAGSALRRGRISAYVAGGRVVRPCPLARCRPVLRCRPMRGWSNTMAASQVYVERHAMSLRPTPHRGAAGRLDVPVLVGLTGGIGSGKSLVAARLAQHGAVVVDADKLAREVVAPGTEGLAEVVAAFGSDVLGP